ncbi:FRG domain-containing protein [Pseudomonas sp. IB20]|uniref:FRG domain-containing protein n=1 Tax=Pseudomonas sp. IB20 TaxID=1702250 RepID=UPI000BA02934|nr:FRG domain-containing protein [Pseudomonas sp. IB20]OZO00939.1 FRG domain-containing protein [Pseudomonas sp. IB20]
MPIKEIHTESLNEFWETISPIGGIIEKMKRPIFRGQGDARWSLTPSVLREDINSKYKHEGGTYTQVDQIIMFEYILLLDFLHFSDEMGFAIPNDSAEFRKHMDFDAFTNRYGIDGAGWPSEEYFSFIALAQHHGIPTRLLDWTKNPFVAAYFSASQALNLNPLPESLAVWLIDSETIKQTDGRLEYVALPGSTSNNLAAQKGVFLIHRQQYGMSRNSSFSSEELKNTVNNIFKDSTSSTAYKITLPAKLAGNLLFRLNKFGVSAATLFPGFDGAARAALEFKMAKKLSSVL